MLNRTKAPTFSQNFSFELPKPEILPLGGDSRIVWLKGIEQNVFKIELTFNSGRWNEQIKGMSQFLALMLDKGTKTRTSKEISNLLDFHGSQLEINPGPDFIGVSLYGLNRYLKETVSVLLDIVTNARFSEDELKLQKEIFKQGLKINNQKTSYVASKLLRQNLFGAKHPYGSYVEEKDLDNIQLNDLHDFFQKQFQLKDVFLVGNPSNGEFKWLFSKLTSISPKHPSIIEQKIHQGSKESISNELKSVQASIRLGKRFINRNNYDYPDCLLANHILGGYFGSRLMKNIREEKGLTYGIHSSIHPFKNDCFLSIGADVNVDKIDLALTEIKKEIEVLMNDPITPDEFLAAKNHFLGNLQLENSNPFSSMEKIKNILLNNLIVNYYDDLFSKIKNSSHENIKDMALQHFKPDSFSEVVVS